MPMSSLLNKPSNACKLKFPDALVVAHPECTETVRDNVETKSAVTEKMAGFCSDCEAA